MARQELTDQIGRILKLGSDYLSWAQSERIGAALARDQVASGREATTGASMLEAQGRRFEARAKLTKIGYPLAMDLEEAGGDPTILRRFLHHIDHGDGPEAASRLWEDLSVQLQRSEPGRKNGPTGGMASVGDLATLGGLDKRQKERLRKRLDRRRARGEVKYIEVSPSDRTPNSPTYLYDQAEAMPIVDSIKLSGASVPRPPKKNFAQ